MALVLSCCVISDKLTILSLILISCEMNIINVPNVYYGDLKKVRYVMVRNILQHAIQILIPI